MSKLSKYGVIGMCATAALALGLMGCNSADKNQTAEPTKTEDAAELPQNVAEGTGEYTFQDADGTYWAVDTEVSRDGRSITVWLPITATEQWTYTIDSEGDAPIAALGDPTVSEDGTTWSAAFSGAAIDPTGDARITFTEHYPAGSQPVYRQFVMNVNVADDDMVSLLGTMGAGFPAEWYDEETSANLGVRVPTAETGEWAFDATPDVLEVVAGPAIDGNVTSISYRALKAGDATISVTRLNDKGLPLYCGTITVKTDADGKITPQKAEWSLNG